MVSTLVPEMPTDARFNTTITHLRDGLPHLVHWLQCFYMMRRRPPKAGQVGATRRSEAFLRPVPAARRPPHPALSGGKDAMPMTRESFAARVACQPS